jgi:iron complex transport system substrate-binding protein
LTFCLLAAPLFASRQLTDETGRRVTVPDHPHRLICLAPNTADAVFALGAGNDVIGVSSYTKYPAEAARKPQIGEPMSPSVELIVSMRPDLVIGGGEFNRSLADKLQNYGIPVYLIAPHGVEGILRSMTSLGHALNRDAQAAALVARLRARIQAVRRRVQGKPPLPVMMLIWHDPVTTIGRDSYISQLIEMAGGRSVTSDLPREWPTISFENLVVRAPQNLLVVRDAKMSFNDLARRPEWQAIPAIRNRHIYSVDERLYLSSPAAIDALEEMAKEFHP